MPQGRTSLSARAAVRWAEAVAASAERPFAAAGAWGQLDGVVVSPPAGARSLFSRARPVAGGPVALVVPQAPGIEQADEAASVDDHLALALHAAGMHVARVRALNLAQPADRDPLGWIDACADALQAAAGVVERPRPALAASWLAGGAAALLASRRDDLAFVVLAGAPVPEVMSRRTSENEDDPAWERSPSLRLVDGLAALAPLESITVEQRPVLVVQGAADATFGAAHLEGWRAAMLATGRPVEAVEIAFVDGFFRSVEADGGVDPADGSGLDTLRAAVASWVAPRAVAAPVTGPVNGPISGPVTGPITGPGARPAS